MVRTAAPSRAMAAICADLPPRADVSRMKLAICDHPAQPGQSYTSVSAANSKASSTSMPRYRTVLSSSVWPNRSCTARRFFGPPINQSRLGPADGMGSVSGRTKTIPRPRNPQSEHIVGCSNGATHEHRLGRESFQTRDLTARSGPLKRFASTPLSRTARVLKSFVARRSPGDPHDKAKVKAMLDNQEHAAIERNRQAALARIAELRSSLQANP